MKAFGIKKIWAGFIYAFCGAILVLSGFPGSAQAAGSYDYNLDNDVDGQDIFEFIQVFNASDLENFASSFGVMASSDCRALLPCHMAEANACFGNAVAADPDPVVKTFHAVTRILSLVYDTDINTLFTELGLGEEVRTLCNWTAEWPRDANDQVVLPGILPSTGDALNVLITAFLPEINGALDELDGLDDTIEEPFIVLCEELTMDNGMFGCENIEVDYGDVALYRALLQGMKAFLLIVDAYNWNIEQTAEVIGKLRENIFVINDYLCDDDPETFTCLPNFLLRDSDAEALLSQAKQSLNKAIVSYFDASAYIRAETDDQSNDTFAFPETPDDAAQEALFRAQLAQIQSALTTTVTLSAFDDENPIDLNLAVFFDNPVDLRNFLPGFTNDNQPVCGSFDPELGGIMPGFGSDGWAEMTGIPVPVSGKITRSLADTGGDIQVKALTYWEGNVSWLGYASEQGALVLSALGSYEMFLGSNLESVRMFAFQDKDADGRLSPGDIYGTYGNNPFNMNSVGCLGPGDIDIDLDQTILGVKGTVTDGVLPISNAHINVYESGTYNYLGWATVDNNGGFTFNTLGAGSVYLYVFDYASQYIGGWWTGSGVTDDHNTAAAIDLSNTDDAIGITLEVYGSVSGN